MKNYKLFIFIMVLIACVSISAGFSADTTKIVDGLNSSSDLTQALKDAGTQNKTVMLLFD